MHIQLKKGFSNCPICNSINVAPLIEDESYSYNMPQNGTVDVREFKYSLVSCNDCGLAYIDPMPTFEVLTCFYVNYSMYAEPIETKIGSVAHKVKYIIAKYRYSGIFEKKSILDYAKNIFGIVAEGLTGKTVSYSLGIPLQLGVDAKIFELGFGNGDWLLKMSQLGYKKLFGYDIDTNSVSKKRLIDNGINITPDEFLSSSFQLNDFDAVRLEHVFEHLLEPIVVMKKIYEILRPGGVLIMNFPCSEGFVFKKYPVDCNYRQSPWHLFLHSKKSTKKLLQDSGFKTINIRQYGVALDLEETLDNKYSRKKLFHQFRFGSLISPFYNILVNLFQRGDYITVMAKKD